MKDAFLNKLVKEVIAKYPDSLKDVCIVVPNRRMILFLEKYLTANDIKTENFPKLIPINDFITELSGYEVAEPLTLVFELYETYKHFQPDETFDQFYPWGEIILSDYDLIDKNLANARALYTGIKNIKELEQEFTLHLTEIESFKKFWESFSDEDISETKKKFTRIWELLGKTYDNFTESLREGKVAYEGLIYRNTAENIEDISDSIDVNIIFAGFNILSKAEMLIIKTLLKKGKAEIYWDTDKYYTDDKKQEAGGFIRKNFTDLEIKKPEIREDLLLTDEKKIDIYAVPLRAGQAKALGKLLNESFESVDPEQTAIVLPDESLLLPLLSALPDMFTEINITMGYSLRNTSLYTLMELLKDMHTITASTGKDTLFGYRYVKDILEHPYIKSIDFDETIELTKKLDDTKRVYFNRELIMEQVEGELESVDRIFKLVERTKDLFDYIEEIIEVIEKNVRGRKGRAKGFEIYQIEQFKKHIKDLKGLMAGFGDEIEPKTAWSILLKTLRSIKIPFTGAPLKGLQIMGVLETRGLDFENVYMLSMNEGTYPRTDLGKTFIPVGIRKAFGLPTFEDDDSGYAYNFYRLMQRARNFTIFYNSEVDELNQGERSRYIPQVEFELCRQNKKIDLNNYIVSAKADAPKLEKIKIEKSDDVMERLKELEFSASRLNTYINCSLQFYFRCIAGLREPEDRDGIIDPRQFGNIVHNTLKRIYEDYIERDITPDDFTSLHNIIDEKLEEVFEIEFKGEDYLSGKNRLTRNIMKKLLGMILETDERTAPFSIRELEKGIDSEVTFPDGDTQVKLQGRLDRVDVCGGKVRIIDYKTGRVEWRHAQKEVSDQFYTEMFMEPKYSSLFQAYLYAYMYLKKNAGERVQVGIYPIKKLSEGVTLLNNGKELTLEQMKGFEERLERLFAEIFDRDTPFRQTTEEERCKYCDYKTICNRNL
ncbi:MAG: PD-(D/E)XK nuclease family protein [Ignavibacteriae bacterium]|nr:PD-(D/E)XK nuclease family protein [Ignavibacteriota bacterium]